MKKTLVVLLVLIVLGSVSGYCIINSVFPKASPISYPLTEEITSISLYENNNNSVTINKEALEPILQEFLNVKPTRKMSVNDYPTVGNYYMLEIEASQRFYRYFIYQEGTQMYIELPYEGIYKINNQLYDSLKLYF